MASALEKYDRAKDMISAVFEEKAELVRMLLVVLAGIDPEKISKAIAQIGMEESVGPLLDPSAWLGSRRFDNAEAWKAVLGKLLALNGALRKYTKQEAEDGSASKA